MLHRQLLHRVHPSGCARGSLQRGEPHTQLLRASLRQDNGEVPSSSQLSSSNAHTSHNNPPEKLLQSPQSCFFRLPGQPGTRQGGGRRAHGRVGTEAGSPSAGGGTPDSGDGRLRRAGGRGAGPGSAGGGGRGWGLAVTDGPDAVECFRKGGGLRRRRDFGHGVW